MMLNTINQEMIKTIFFLFWISLAGFNAGAGDYSRQQVHRKVEQIPAKSEKSPEKIASYIQKHFENEEAQAYAVYYYVANALEYNFEESRRITINASREKIVEDALQDRVGVCQHYAELFHAIALEMDFRSVVVTGYTCQNGDVVEVPHAWNALEIDDKWWLFDPTWGSGYMTGNEYKTRYSREYFKVAPQKMIRTHMPFDPLMQFLKEPVNHFGFARGDFSETRAKSWNAEKLLDDYFSKDDRERISAQMKRIREHGVVNEMTEKYYNFLRQNFRVHEANRQIELHNQAIKILNNVVERYNAYAKAKNENRGNYPDTKENTLELLEILQKRTEYAGDILSKVKPTLKMQETYYKNLKIIKDLKKQLSREQNHIKNN